MIRKKRPTFSPKLDIVFLGAVIGGFVAICASLVGKASIWFDEAFGAYLIRFDFAELTYYTGRDVHPPLYYYCLKLWSAVFGASDVALRSMSIFFAVIALILMFFLVRKLFGRKAAYVSVLLLALSPMLVRYGIEMRMYSLLIAIVIGATYALLQATRTNNKKWWITYGILLALGMLTHYLVAVVWLAHWAWRAIETRQKTFSKWRRAFFAKAWVWTHVLAVALFLPWLPWLILRVIDVQSNGFWIPPVTPSVLLDYVTNFFLYQNGDNVNSYLTLGLLVFLGVGAYKLPSLLRAFKGKDQRSVLALMACIAFVPTILLILMSLPPLQSSFMDRYLLASLAFSAVLIAILLTRLYDTNRLVATGGILLTGIFFVIGITNVAHYGNFNKIDNTSTQTRQLIEQIRKTEYGARPIIASSPWIYYEAAQYSRQDSGDQVYFLDEQTEYRYGSLEMLKQNDTGKIKSFSKFLTNQPLVWYIGRPGDGELTAPSDHLKSVTKISLEDQITEKPAYQAILYEIH